MWYLLSCYPLQLLNKYKVSKDIKVKDSPMLSNTVVK